MTQMRRRIVPKEIFFDDSDSIEAVVSGERPAKNIYVPIFTAETIHGLQGSTL